MNKPFLLIAGYTYYPERGTGDWIDCFASREEAEKMVKRTEYGRYKIKHSTMDWYEIIDLREWTK